MAGTLEEIALSGYMIHQSNPPRLQSTHPTQT